MSAYMVDREHVSYLVEAAMNRPIVRDHTMSWYHDGERHALSCGDFQRAAEVGQMLWDANKESIMARYPDTREDFSDAPGPCDETFVYDEHINCPMHVFSPVAVLQAINCFNYQACEYEGWKDSEAKAFLEALKHHAIGALPGMEDAAWGAPESYRPIRPVRPNARAVRRVTK